MDEKSLNRSEQLRALGALSALRQNAQAQNILLREKIKRRKAINNEELVKAISILEEDVFELKSIAENKNRQG